MMTDRNLIKTTLRLAIIGISALLVVILFAKIDKLYFHKDPDVILITAEALRPDHLGYFGYEDLRTRAIDDFFRKSIIFRNSYSNTPSSVFSCAAILSGTSAGNIIQMKGDMASYKEKYTFLPEYIKKNGYNTLAVISSLGYEINKKLSKKFDHFISISPSPHGQEKPIDPVKQITQNAITLLDNYAKGKKPFFLWMKYPIPSFPYNVPDDFGSAKDEHPYDRQIVLLDEEIGKIIQQTKKLGIYNNSIIILTATSGEALGEHNEYGSGIFIYNSTTRVPFAIKFQKNHVKRTLNTSVSHEDITPTILDIAGIEYDPSRFDGESLLPLIGSAEINEPVRDIYLESLIAHYDFGWSPVLGLISEDYKYIELPETELYSLKKDPHELENIIFEKPEKAREMKNKLIRYIKTKRPELVSLLNKGADPKEKILLVRPFRIQTSEITVVIDFYKNLLARDPQNKEFSLKLAHLYIRNNAPQDAVNMLSELVKKYPDSNRAWELLGASYQKEGDPDKAIRSYEKALSIYPDMPTALNNLAVLYSENNTNLNKALAYSKKANKINPHNPFYIDTLADINLELGNKETAKELYTKAISCGPAPELLKQLKNKLENIE